MEKTTSKNYSLIAAILLTVLALYEVLIISMVFGSNWAGWLIFDLPEIIVLAVTAVLFFKKTRNKGTLVALIALALSWIYSFALLGVYDLGWMFGYYGIGIMILVLLLPVLSAIFLSVLAVANLAGFTISQRQKVNRLWFIPTAAIGLFIIIMLMEYYTWYGMLHTLLYAAAFLFISLWLAYPNGIPRRAASSKNESNTCCTRSFDDAYCSLLEHILLLIFTFGIWLFIWIYHMTGYTNAVEDEPPRNQTNTLLLCIFIPFYLIYWCYKTAQRVDKIAAENGVTSDLATLCLVLAIFVPIIPPILIQDKINSIISANSSGEDTTAGKNEHSPIKRSTPLGVADELKKYKELLDMGIITQEEFDAKKEQLLGI